MRAHTFRSMFPQWGTPTPFPTDLQSSGEIRLDLDTSTQSRNSSLVACSVVPPLVDGMGYPALAYTLGVLHSPKNVVQKFSPILIPEEASPFHFFLELAGFSLLGWQGFLVQTVGPNHPNYHPSTHCSNALRRALRGVDDTRLDHILPLSRIRHSCCTFDVLCHHYSLISSLYQLFGSMPRCCNSLRMMRFIHAARDSSPSCFWASSIKSRSSGSSRNWNGGLPRLSFLCVDTFSTPDVVCLCVITHYMHMNEKATPRSAGTLSRRLTKPLYEVTIMADIKSTQTRPKFTFLFLAIDRANRAATPCRMSVEAHTEREARQVLAPHFILSLAARLPVREASHV